MTIHWGHALGLLLTSSLLTGCAGGCSPGADPLRAAPLGGGERVCRGTLKPRPGRATQGTYGRAKLALESRRKQLARQYRAAPARRAVVLRRAQRAVEDGLRRELMPRWCGTPWAFHGTTQRPGSGTIACGYFVSTLLRDAGFRVERFRLARRPSEAIIKSLTSERFIRRFSNTPIKSFVASVRAQGPGLYVVGLDFHTGFLIVRNGRVRFVHASYLKPYCVVEEDALRSPALVSSKYRVVGRISADPKLIRKWLSGERIATR